MITVRPLQGLSDCEKVVELTAAAFPEEVLGSGLTAGSWRELELEDLVKQAWCWPNIGEVWEGAASLFAATQGGWMDSTWQSTTGVLGSAGGPSPPLLNCAKRLG